MNLIWPYGTREKEENQTGPSGPPGLNESAETWDSLEIIKKQNYLHPIYGRLVSPAQP